MLKRIITVFLIGGALMLGLSGCLGKSYSIDYNGKKSAFANAKDSYKAGSTVTLHYNRIATDTDYSFYLDGERINPDYNGSKGYKIQFKMPEHNVSLTVEAKRAMQYEPDKKTAELTFESFDGGGPQYEVKIKDNSIVTYDTVKKYHNNNHEQMAGSGYTVTITFFGLKEGKTTATVECRSPIAENFDAVYEISVDSEMNVTVNELETKEIYQ